jgi:hypothetical protein
VSDQDPNFAGLLGFLEAICKTDVPFDRRGVVSHRVEEGFWFKAGEIECNDRVTHRSPPNLKISLVAEIARMACAGWINQRSASESIDAVVGRFPPIPVPGNGSSHVRSQLELKHRMHVDQVLRSQ